MIATKDLLARSHRIGLVAQKLSSGRYWTSRLGTRRAGDANENTSADFHGGERIDAGMPATRKNLLYSHRTSGGSTGCDAPPRDGHVPAESACARPSTAFFRKKSRKSKGRKEPSLRTGTGCCPWKALLAVPQRMQCRKRFKEQHTTYRISVFLETSCDTTAICSGNGATQQRSAAGMASISLLKN